MFVINGVELYFDISDYEFMEKFTSARSKVNKIAEEVDSEKDEVKRLKLAVKMYRSLFEDLYGSETALKIVEHPSSVMEWGRAFEKMIQYSLHQSKEMNDMNQRIISYSLSDSREERHKNEHLN